MYVLRNKETVVEYYKRELVDLCETLNISIEIDKGHAHDEMSVTYNNSMSIVFIETGNMWITPGDFRAPISLYHELGHYFDLKEVHGCSRKYKRKPRKDREVDAWIYGAHLAKAFRFREWDLLESFARECLRTYAVSPARIAYVADTIEALKNA